MEKQLHITEKIWNKLWEEIPNCDWGKIFELLEKLYDITVIGGTFQHGKGIIRYYVKDRQQIGG